MNDLIRDAYAAIVAEAPPAPELPHTTAPPARRRLPAPAIVLAAAAMVLAAVGVPYLLLAGDRGGAGAPASGAPSWREGAPPPFSPRTVQFAAPLSDGRALMWGGTELPFPTGSDATARRLLDGGIYDPESDTWERIEPPDFMPAPREFESEAVAAQLADDRLMILQFGGDLGGAVYDVGTGGWTEITGAPGIDVTADAVAWTGDTLVLVRLWKGEAPWDVAAPLAARWSFDTRSWTAAAAPPLSLRLGAGTGFDGERLAVWGGALGENADLPGPATFAADGAIYDVAADTWTAMEPGPAGDSHATVAWIDEGLFVAGSLYDPDDGTWAAFPAPPAGAAVGKTIADKWEYRDGERQLLTTGSLVGHSGAHPAQLWVDGAWVDAPAYDVHLAGARLVATTRTGDNPDNLPFRAHRRDGEGWADLGPAPFTNRMESGVVAIDDRLVVVAGASGRTLQPAGDTWLLDIGG